jgi:hypothetical protein
VILADSSAWIEYLRRTGSPAARALQALSADEDTLLVGDLILFEVLQGAPSDGAADEVRQMMLRHAVVAIGSQVVAIAAAEHHRRLRALGITVRSSIDLLIGTFCIVNGHALLHRDRDFDAMERQLGLRVVPA